MKLKTEWKDNIEFIIEAIQNSLTKENITESKTTLVAGVIALQEFIKILPESFQPYAAIIFIGFLFFHGVTKI